MSMGYRQPHGEVGKGERVRCDLHPVPLRIVPSAKADESIVDGVVVGLAQTLV